MNANNRTITPRQNIKSFTEIPNVGPATAEDFRVLGLSKPSDLIGKDPYRLYQQLCQQTSQQHDPCVIDVFIAAVRYMEGGPSRKWWEFTNERKQHLKNQS